MISYGAYLRAIDRNDAPLAVLEFGRRCGHPIKDDPLRIPEFLRRG